MYDGWELDNDIWLCRMKKGPDLLIGTSHNWHYVVEQQELVDTINNHKKYAKDLEELLKKKYGKSE